MIQFDKDTLIDNAITCEKRVSADFAIVDVVFKTAFVSKLKQDVKNTFSDKLYNIGLIKRYFYISGFIFHESFV